MKTRTSSIAIALALCAPAAMACVATPAAPPTSCTSVAYYVAQGVNHNVPQLPGAIITGQLERESSYLNALSLRHLRSPLASHFDSLAEHWLGGWRPGVEFVVARHHGLQSLTEFSAGLALRTSDLAAGNHRFAFAGTVGASTVNGTPTYEDGPLDAPEERYRTQAFLALDAEYAHLALPQLALVARLHHRSGAYGLVAPRNVGSNFIGLGLRYSFGGF